MKLGDNIFMIRKAKWKMTQGKFGEILGVSKSQIVSYEKSGVIPKIEFFLRLVEVSGIPVYDLCKRSIESSEIPDKPIQSDYQLKEEGVKELSEPSEIYNTKEMKSLIKTVDYLRERLEACENSKGS